MISELQKKRMDDAIHFIAGFMENEGISPTIREIQAHLGLSSPSTAYEIVRGLKRRGWITSKRNCPRTIIITRRKDPTGERKNE